MPLVGSFYNNIEIPIMKRALIRCLYGEANNPNHDSSGSRNRIDKDVSNVIKNNEENYVTYVMGDKNYQYLKQKGLKNVIMATNNIWPQGGRGSFINKMVAWKYAMQDYDEIVFLDWDTIQIKPLPDNFWEEFAKKDKIQSPLYKCRRRTSCWRPHVDRLDNKRGCSGCFVYMRDKSIPDELLKLVDDPIIKPFSGSYSDETYLNRYVDILTNGWKGKDYYYGHFEPQWCMVQHPAYIDCPDHYTNACFKHPLKG